MFRRRRLGRRFAGAQGVPPAIRDARQLMEEGNYEEAAAAFSELAENGQDRFPRRAPLLFIQAGHATILAGDAKEGVSYFSKGLNLLAAQGRFHRLNKVGQRIIGELRERGLNAEADEVVALLKGNPAASAADTAPSPKKRGVLPTHCPSCGAAVKPDEVDWMDDITAECDYCGSPIRTTS